ncbi:DUF397 domain-containing protein [Streptomyces albidoflavus]|uniref:DUF397 domain-containing protein n=1 Tax=Streptomyces albidoflavus TaxID=1886 RepID=A0ABY3GR32_9ACTN|nr:DUF397 domain-containing protein [Streptomyces albidoflavus]PJT52277.1 DUF397 domain-containing protein [Streptomyces albidoflavus]TWV17730.1 DUF397 domain-containing protein [Streptomyces albidoflavus]
MTIPPLAWFKSSYSTDGGQCVEVAANLVASHGMVPVRDSKIQSGPVLALPASSFSAFVAKIKAGDFPV